MIAKAQDRPSARRPVSRAFINAWRGLLVRDEVTATFDHSLELYVTGAVVWSLALLAVMTPLALRSYRTE